MNSDQPSSALNPPAVTPDELTVAFKALAEDFSSTPKMTEQMFIEHILPMLSVPAGTKVDLTRWLDVAGTPLRPIDVVDTDTGAILYRVPPLMRTMPTAMDMEINYHTMVTEAQLRENVHGAMADTYLRQQLMNIRTGATLLDVETAKLWNVIRHRYKLPLIPVVDEQGHVMTVSDTSSSASATVTFADDQDDF